MAYALESTVAFTAQFVDFAIQVPDDLHGLVDRCPELAAFALPPTNAIHLSGPAAHLSVNLLAQLALGTGGQCLHDKLHTTRFTHSVLLGTMLSEVAPFPIATGKAVLVEEAHVSSLKS